MRRGERFVLLQRDGIWQRLRGYVRHVHDVSDAFSSQEDDMAVAEHAFMLIHVCMSTCAYIKNIYDSL